MRRIKEVDMDKALKKMKQYKAVCRTYNSLTDKIIFYELANLFNKLWRTQKIPKGSRISIIASI